MAAEIVKVYKEHLPSLRLIGKCYTNADRICILKFQENGMGNFKSDDQNRACFFERYHCLRFTEADEMGNVILDYGIYLT